MYRNIITAILIFLISTSIFAGDGKSYGKKLTLKNTTKVSAILEDPSAFEGKRVKIEGTVVGVCENAGCWIEIAGDDAAQKIKVKVKDGDIVFPLEAKGKTAIVEGEMYSLEVDKTAECSEHEDSDEGNRHHDSDKKEDDLKSKDKVKIYQIRGIGAVIK